MCVGHCVPGARRPVVLYAPRFGDEARTSRTIRGIMHTLGNLGLVVSAEMNALVRYPFTFEHATLVEPRCRARWWRWHASPPWRVGRV
jgi:hypothetical protein